MSTPHNRAEKGDFAKTVLMPGDPLRAKFIAETFLENPRVVTDVRGMLGYTGTYQGRPISVMGSGMGMPSIGIYSYELFSQYGVENIIRIGSAGSYTDKAKLFDVVLATGAYSESNYAVTQSGDTDDIQTPSAELNDALRAIAEADMLIIGGTSLNVYPAAGLINYYRGHKLVLINKSAVARDVQADLVITDPIGETLAQL